MTSDEFDDLVNRHTYRTGGYDEMPLTPTRLVELERQLGIRLPGFYKDFLTIYGAGDFGAVTVLSPDSNSEFPIWQRTALGEDRECNFIGVVELDSDYYGFLVEHGVCSTDMWSADQELGYEICSTDYPDFFEFLIKVALGLRSDQDEPGTEFEEE